MISRHYVLYHVLPFLVVLLVGMIIHKLVIQPMTLFDTTPANWGAVMSPLFLVGVVCSSVFALVCLHKQGAQE